MIEFAAVIAYTGIETRGGWYLTPLTEGDPVPVVRRLPLPVYGQPGSGHGRIGFLEHLAYLRDAVVGRGFLDNTTTGRDYAGSLRLGLTRMVMEGETGGWVYDDPGSDAAEPVYCEEWRVCGASVQVAPSWDLPTPEIHIRGMV